MEWKRKGNKLVVVMDVEGLNDEEVAQLVKDIEHYSKISIRVIEAKRILEGNTNGSS